MLQSVKGFFLQNVYAHKKDSEKIIESN